MLAKINQKEVILDLPDEEERKGFSKANKALLDGKEIQNLGWKKLFSLDKAIRNTVEIIRSENSNV